jgi:hypothetical protein
MLMPTGVFYQLEALIVLSSSCGTQQLSPDARVHLPVCRRAIKLQPFNINFRTVCG